MGLSLKDMRPVYVVGVGFHRYQSGSDTPYVTLGLAAVREALQDARMDWPAVESAYVGTCLLPLAPGRPMLRHLGATGLPIIHVENASASGSAAFRQACIDVASGVADVSIAIGVDKPTPRQRAENANGLESLAEDAIVPFTHFALLANRYAHKHDVSVEDIALVAVKNHRNGALNPNAQRQQVRTLDEVLGGRRISGMMTALQCTPVGEGAAAAIVASEAAVKALGLDPGRAIRVASSATRSQRVYDDATRYDTWLTRETTELALAQAQRTPAEVDILELHDAFTVEELDYLEAMGICGPGEAVPMLKEGQFDIGGRCAVSASGGLIAMGHPIGPTGVGQVNEIVTQLRGEAGPRQHGGARVGLAHMVGVGAISYVHVLERP